MGKSQAFSARERIAVVEYVKRSSNVAAAVAQYFPLQPREAASARRKLVNIWVRDEE